MLCLATASNGLFDFFRRIERLVRQNLSHCFNDLWVCTGLLSLGNNVIFIQRVGESAQHPIELATLIELIIVNLHTTPSFWKYTRDFFVADAFLDHLFSCGYFTPTFSKKHSYVCQ